MADHQATSFTYYHPIFHHTEHHGHDYYVCKSGFIPYTLIRTLIGWSYIPSIVNFVYNHFRTWTYMYYAVYLEESYVFSYNYKLTVIVKFVCIWNYDTIGPIIYSSERFYRVFVKYSVGIVEYYFIGQLLYYPIRYINKISIR